MTQGEDSATSEAVSPSEAGARARARVWRSVVLPLLVVGAIAGAIWWLEYRPEARECPRSPISGQCYGPTDLAASQVPPGMKVGPDVGKLAPDFFLETLTGGELRLSDLRGRAVVLNFWATWCLPCRKEIPQLVAAYNQFADQGLVVVGVNLQESPDTIRRYAEDFGMDFPIALDRRGSVADEYRLLGIPTTYFIDRQGVVRSVFRGPFLGQLGGTNVQEAIEENELLKRIQEILE